MEMGTKMVMAPKDMDGDGDASNTDAPTFSKRCFNSVQVPIHPILPLSKIYNNDDGTGQ